MDPPVDAWVVLPAVVFTLLAVVVATVVLRKNERPADSTSTPKSRDVSEDTHKECELSRPLEALGHSTGERERTTERSEEQLSSKGNESQSTAHTVRNLEEKPYKSHQVLVGNKCEAAVARNDESASFPSVKKGGHEEKPLRYMPGMLRTSQLEKMMSKEELEEERRVQQEQLAAIFKLLKENQDTFGEVTEKDMEEQLKLYSI
ncbi:matrix-remodeling-associated protein 7-like isoform X1 [Pygocentrus nattereri]|uniref:Matrix-remodeling-associated protein 7 helical domain-containing protein n=1 Tax=Pygocentrus nattereri TaxID=42514 RepID=A0A3B4C032_PYGNA|nr:matrix-remodeling-associated protein 7-like isoform X1 [Pygocentrus nattereri]